MADRNRSRTVCFQFKGKLDEYKFNTEDINNVFRKFYFWHYNELGALTTARAREFWMS